MRPKDLSRSAEKRYYFFPLRFFTAAAPPFEISDTLKLVFGWWNLYKRPKGVVMTSGMGLCKKQS